MYLNTDVCGIRLQHPVMNASGILGSHREHIARLAEYGVSAIVTKTITSQPREGYETPIVIELPSGGVLNAVGLANPGKEAIHELVAEAKRFGLPIIVSIGGRDEREFVDVAIEAEKSGANAIELNLSCPHAKGYGIEIGSEPNTVRTVVREVSSVLRIPVIAKLGICDKLVVSASSALEAGARALTLINTVKAMYIDVFSAKPVLSNVFGGLSGPPIHPLAVRAIYEVYRELKAEIIGCGGVYDWRSAAEMILAGARAVQVGTAFIYGSGRKVVESILSGLSEWLRMLGLKSIYEAIGLAQRV